MNILFLFNPRTIRQRLMLLNSITFLLIVLLISIYSYQLVILENNLVRMERVDDMFSTILSLRRYEKNIMLGLDEDSISKAGQALRKIELSFSELGNQFCTSQGEEVFQQLEEKFFAYQKTFQDWCASGTCTAGSVERKEARLIRQLGQELVDSASALARFYRKSISQEYKEILFWLTFMPALVFFGGAFLFFSQVKGILRRLNSLNKATISLAAGEFKPIPTLRNPDEISDLVINFNQMVEALEQKQEELIQSKKMASIGTFSSGIAHEINNPLNNISLSADTLIEEMDSMDKEEVREILEDIMTQTERASKIVRNLLDFSRAQSSEKQPLYIDFILHKTTDLIANELRINKIKLVKEIPDMLPRISGDLQKLQQVFLNLIINAEQAIGSNGTITVRAGVTDDGYIRTDIIDTGLGISQEHIEQIFDPFFTTKDPGHGTGLGLAIVYGIVKKHGGYIEVASTLGQGTTFSVYLPILKDEGKEKKTG